MTIFSLGFVAILLKPAPRVQPAMHGCNAINNNAMSNGTGRDFCIFGDTNYNKGKYKVSDRT